MVLDVSSFPTFVVVADVSSTFGGGQSDGRIWRTFPYSIMYIDLHKYLLIYFMLLTHVPVITVNVFHIVISLRYRLNAFNVMHILCAVVQ